MGKTPSYTLRAAKNYRDKHDFFNLTFKKGTRDRAAAVGLTAGDMSALVVAEIERREAEQAQAVPGPELPEIPPCPF